VTLNSLSRKSLEETYVKRLAIVAAFAITLSLTAVQPGTQEADASSTFTIDPMAQLSGGGTQATLTGTLSCPEGETVNFFVSVTQFRHGHVVSSALGFAEPVVCDGSVQSWTLTVISLLGFQPGKASAVASVCCPDLVQTGVGAQIRLKP
jgi:hypothetical protein